MLKSCVIRCFVTLFMVTVCLPLIGQKQNHQKTTYAIVIHGGAGTIDRASMKPEMEKAYREKLNESLSAGYDILEKGGSAMDAVAATILIMEDSPLFNAGRGSVYNRDGNVECDAAVMDGKSGLAGAVAGISTIRNPIMAALAVMQKSKHVMMVGKGAESFAAESGTATADSDWFFDQRRWNQHLKMKDKEKSDTTGWHSIPGNSDRFGTVGAVALDQHGNVAAGTSTGGMGHKLPGRVGDAPVIGSGTYASNKTCAVSATGHGEFFIRSVVAYDIAAIMEYRKKSLVKAANEVVMKKLVDRKGEGGVVAIDRKGNMAMPFNSSGMYRGFAHSSKGRKVMIYKDE
jgi:L-asparaginase / beta-aspartyl-peptidase